MKTKRFNSRLSALLVFFMLVSVLFTQIFSVSVFAEPEDAVATESATEEVNETNDSAETAEPDAAPEDDAKICSITGAEHEYKQEIYPASCTKDGQSTYICTDCGYTYSEVLPATHTYGEWKTVEESEDGKKGVQQRVCAECGDIEEKECDHSYPEKWTTEKEATDTEVGVKTKTCENCGNVITENYSNYEASGSMWDFLAVPLGWIIRLFNKASFPYIISLLFFAIAMKIILFPFGIKQQKNMVKQASLRPKEAAIRKKYAGRNDKVTQQKVQQEIMDLYQREHFNPASGCLPLLLQMPILFALFQVVYNPLRHIAELSIDNINAVVSKLSEMGIAVKSGYYDLNVLDKLNKLNDAQYASVQKAVTELPDKANLPELSFFGMDLAGTPMDEGGWYWLIPILTLVIVYLTSLLTRKFSYQPEQTPDAKKSGCVMDYVMPLMSAYFALMFPAVLGIYWMFQNVLGVLQQILLKKMYPTPEFTEEEYAAAEREILGKGQNKKKKAGNYKRHPNSLHHVDDEDEDEEEAPAPKTKKSAPEEPKASNDLITPAPLKDEGEDTNDNDNA